MKLLIRLVLVLALLPALGGSCGRSSSGGSEDENEEVDPGPNCTFRCLFFSNERNVTADSAADCEDMCVAECNPLGDFCDEHEFDPS